MTHTTESRWYTVLVFLVSIITVGVTIANAIYFNRIRNDVGCDSVSRGEATTMLWFNIILLIIATLISLWSLGRLIFTGTRDKVTHYVVDPTGTQIGDVPTVVTSSTVATSPTESRILLAAGTAQNIAVSQQYL